MEVGKVPAVLRASPTSVTSVKGPYALQVFPLPCTAPNPLHICHKFQIPRAS